MNRNRKLRKQMMSGLAVGMAAVMGAAPVYAATGEDAAVSKEETVYVNANADGSEDQITVSNWLKNAGTEKNLQDESELKDIKNVKGDEEFTQSGNKLTWQTDGEDIYYQGTTTKEPPVSVKFTYYLDGKEIKPDDLAGKSGKLKIKVDYTNNTKTTVDINGKKETMYTPFVLMTGMILPLPLKIWYPVTAISNCRKAWRSLQMWRTSLWILPSPLHLMMFSTPSIPTTSPDTMT